MSVRGLGEESPSLTADEKRYFGQLFKAADAEGLGVITGDVAVKFFEKSGLASATLGQIWEISDKDNTGFLTPQSFSVALRLIGQAQNGQQPDASLAKRAGPLPRFEGFNVTSAKAPAVPAPKARSGVPTLTPEDHAKYLLTWQNVNPSSPLLDGDRARTVFQKAALPNEQLGQIWALTDTKQRGALDKVEFIVAMHLIQSVMNGAIKSIPASLSPAFFEAAAREPSVRSHRQQPSGSSLLGQEPLQQQFSGQRQPNMPLRTQLTGPPGRASPVPQMRGPAPPAQVSESWDVKPHEKANYDTLFATIDKGDKGYITGEEAVGFFMQSKLPEEELAQVWDLSDVDNSGMLNQDAFAVAMHLIKQRMRGVALPNMLPASLIPPALRPKVAAPTAAVFAEAQAQAAPQPSSAAADLFGLNDSFAAPAPSKSPPIGAFADSFGSKSIDQLASPVDGGSVGRSFGGKPAFVPSSSFGQAIQQQPQFQQPPGAAFSSQGSAAPVSRGFDQDLLGDAAPQDKLRNAGDATEIANLNNSVSSIQKQSATAQQERGQAEADISRLKTQKTELTARLAQARGVYDQEVAAVRALQHEQAQLQKENQELAKEASLLEASLNAIRQSHEQLTQQVTQDRSENAAIKDKIRLANEASATLKAQLETLKKDTKQQRGLVAINTKQLANLEAEHAKLRKSIEEEKQAAAAAEKERIELEEKSKAIELERAKALEEQKQSAFSPAAKSVAMPALATGALAAGAIAATGGLATGALAAGALASGAMTAQAAQPELPNAQFEKGSEAVQAATHETAASPTATTRMNPFHRAISANDATTSVAPTGGSAPTGIFARLNDGSDDAPAYPFVKPAAAGAVVAGVGAGAAAVAFGHQGKPSQSGQSFRADSPDSVYDTAPNTADSAAVHPAFANAFTERTPHTEKVKSGFSDDFSQPPAFTDAPIQQDAPRDTAPAEFQTFEHAAPEFANEASELPTRRIVSPQPIAAHAQNWSNEDAFTRDARIDSPALTNEPKELRGASLLGFRSHHSDDGSVATSVQAQPPASELHSPEQSRMSTPVVASNMQPTQPTLAPDEQVDAAAVQNTLTHAPHDEERTISPEIYKQTVADDRAATTAAHEQSQDVETRGVEAAKIEKSGGAGLSGLLGNIFSSSKKNDGDKAQPKNESEDSFEHLEAAEEAESSDDETIERPKGAEVFGTSTRSPGNNAIGPAREQTALQSSELPSFSDRSNSTQIAAVPMASGVISREDAAETLLPQRSTATHAAASTPVKPAKDEFDEFDDLEEAQEVEDDEVNQSYMSQEFDPTFDTGTARSSMLPPISNAAPNMAARSASPAQDWSDFSHYSSVVGDRSSTIAPLPSNTAQAFGLGAGSAANPGSAFDSAFVDSGNAKSVPPTVPPHSHGSKAIAPPLASSQASNPPPAPPAQRGHSLSAPKPDLTRQISAADDPMLVELMDMGFDRQKSVAALEKFNYDLGSATHYLLGGN